MLAAKMSVGVTPQMNLKNPLHTGDEAHKCGIHPGFDTQGRHHQKSKTGISGPTKRTNVLQNFFIKMIHMMITKQEPLLCSNMCTQWYTLCCDQSNDKLFIGLENNTKRCIVNKIQNLYIGEVFFSGFSQSRSFTCCCFFRSWSQK